MKAFRTFKALPQRQQRSGRMTCHQYFSVRENWWVLLFCALIALWYWHGMREKESIYADLQNRLGMIHNELQLASSEQEELLRQIHSQSDPAWIELVLMKRLGLVPEGQTKVYFEKAQP